MHAIRPGISHAAFCHVLYPCVFKTRRTSAVTDNHLYLLSTIRGVESLFRIPESCECHGRMADMYKSRRLQAWSKITTEHTVLHACTSLHHSLFFIMHANLTQFDAK
jgi:hypothetical protein